MAALLVVLWNSAARGGGRMRFTSRVAIALLLIVLVSCSQSPKREPISLPSLSSPTPAQTTPETPSPPSGNYAANLEVTNFCLCDGLRNQFMVKMKVRITSVSQVPLNASIENMRLMVAGDMPGIWSPNQPVAAPSVVNIEGRVYTAIPANANRAFERVDANYITFASFWYASRLDPRASYFGEGRSNGDLVFYVPYAPGGRPSLAGVGLVSNDGTQVLGWAPISAWPPNGPEDPNTF